APALPLDRRARAATHDSGGTDRPHSFARTSFIPSAAPDIQRPRVVARRRLTRRAVFPFSSGHDRTASPSWPRCSTRFGESASWRHGPQTLEDHSRMRVLMMPWVCPSCASAFLSDETLVFKQGRPAHLDCQRPRALSPEERILLFAYCREHAVAE